jgi:hypothetical protein
MRIHQIVRRLLILIAVLSLGAWAEPPLPAGATGTPRVEQLTAVSPNAKAITGNVRLLNNPAGLVTQIVFANGRSLRLSHGAQGVYAVTPPTNPALLNGKHLCPKNVTSLAFAWGIRGSVSFEAYDGPMTGSNHCGSYDYSEK